MGLDLVECMMEVEEAFHISISDEEAGKIRTVRDLVGTIRRHVEERRDVVPPDENIRETVSAIFRKKFWRKREVRMDDRLTDLFPCD